MGPFEFTTEGVEAGYGQDGFFAFGTTTAFKFDRESWGFDPYPSVRPFTLEWRIDTKGECQWERYDFIARSGDRRPTAREDEIKRVFAKPLVGLFWRAFPDEFLTRDKITLNYSLPADPSLAAFIMGVVGAGRQLDFYCPGFMFRPGDEEVAAAPTVDGWMDRREPHFMTDPPIMRVK